MKQFLTGLGILVIIGFCLSSGLGFWHFVNSEAAEAQSWAVVESITKVTVMLGTGLLVILICLGLGGFVLLAGFGVRAGAEPLANAVGTYLLTKHDIERNRSRPMIAPPQEPRFFDVIVGSERYLPLPTEDVRK